jgi:hypothetical protein
VSELLPAESMALTVARAQLGRGENPEINVTTMLVMTIERLAGIRDYAVSCRCPEPCDAEH